MSLCNTSAEYELWKVLYKKESCQQWDIKERLNILNHRLSARQNENILTEENLDNNSA
jgi:hypothetical protein